MQACVEVWLAEGKDGGEEGSQQVWHVVVGGCKSDGEPGAAARRQLLFLRRRLGTRLQIDASRLLNLPLILLAVPPAAGWGGFWGWHAVLASPPHPPTSPPLACPTPSPATTTTTTSTGSSCASLPPNHAQHAPHTCQR